MNCQGFFFIFRNGVKVKEPTGHRCPLRGCRNLLHQLRPNLCRLLGVGLVLY